MSFFSARRSVWSGAFLLIGCHAAPLRAQHVHEPAASAVPIRFGVHAVGLLTHATPMLRGESMTEGYLTQPTLLGAASLFGGLLRAHATISLEGLTLDRGELGAGTYGEGYVDRRHPHTYLHELLATVARDVGAFRASATIGRGFAPFGTDDPMMRPFVKYPVNHHLAQILERLIAIGAVRRGGVLLEAGVFSGNEPVGADDMGSIDRFGDSWAARVTIEALPGVELQTSRAWVVSPELPLGGAWDQRKLSASARYQRTHAIGAVYALAEWKRTTEVDRGTDVFAFGSWLGEASLSRAGWTPALRVERTQRPEEERLANAFRSPWPHAETHVFGITTWTIVAARLEKDVRLGVARIAPFIEASHARVKGNETDLFEAVSFYAGGSECSRQRVNAAGACPVSIWTFNVGARIGAGWHPVRMGRYGVAQPSL